MSCLQVLKPRGPIWVGKAAIGPGSKILACPWIERELRAHRSYMDLRDIMFVLAKKPTVRDSAVGCRE